MSDKDQSSVPLFREIMEDLEKKGEKDMQEKERPAVKPPLEPETEETPVNLDNVPAVVEIDWDEDDGSTSGIILYRDGSVQTKGSYTPGRAAQEFFEALSDQHPFKLFSAQLEAVPADCPILLVKDPGGVYSGEDMELLGTYLASKHPEMTILFVPADVTIEALSEETMEFAGWQKKPVQ